MNNKRKFVRFKIGLDSGIGRITDFSRDGLRVRSARNLLAEKNLVFFECQLPDTDRFAALDGQIRWCRATGAEWEMGVKIERMNAADKNEILAHAYRMWRNERGMG